MWLVGLFRGCLSSKDRYFKWPHVKDLKSIADLTGSITHFDGLGLAYFSYFVRTPGQTVTVAIIVVFVAGWANTDPNGFGGNFRGGTEGYFVSYADAYKH